MSAVEIRRSTFSDRILAALAKKASDFQAGMVRTLATARVEARLNLMTPAPWVVGFILAVFAYLLVRTSPDPSSYLLAWVLSAEQVRLSTLLLLVLAASFAHRPQRYELNELLDSKLVASEELVFGGWLAMLVAVSVPLLIQYGVAIVAQEIHGKGAVELSAYGWSLLRVAPPILFLSTAAFGLVKLLRILVLGSGLAGIAWFVFIPGESYFPSSLWLRLSQNGIVFLGLTAAMLLLLLAGSQARRRHKRAATTYAFATLSGFIVVSVAVYAAWLAQAVPSSASAAAGWKRLNGGHPTPKDPLPNLSWIDNSGSRVSLSTYRGRVLLLVLVQPRDAGLLPTLQRIDGVRRQFSKGELGVLGVFVSEDLNASRDAGRLLHVGFPLVTDWGMLRSENFDPKEPTSLASWAYHAGHTPEAILVGRDGRELARDLPLDDEDVLKAKLDAAVAGEEIPFTPTPAAPGGIPGVPSP